MDVLRNQTVEPRRRESLESHDQAAAALERLKRLRSRENRKLGFVFSLLQSLKSFFSKLSQTARIATFGGAGAVAALALIAGLAAPAFSGTSTAEDIAVVANSQASESQIDQTNVDNPATGSGYVQITREKDFVHQVRDGENLSEIAYFYGIDFGTLAKYNKLANPDSLFAGQELLIPSKSHEGSVAEQASIAKLTETTKSKTAEAVTAAVSPSDNGSALIAKPLQQPASVRNAATATDEQLIIAADEQFDGAAITAHFRIESPGDRPFSSYEWDLGNNRRAFRESTFWTYEQPGTYTVKLKARTKTGKLIESNSLFIDVPHPASTSASGQQRFVTLNTKSDTFKLDGELTAVSGYSRPQDSPIVRVGEDEGFGLYQSNEAGFFGIQAENASGPYEIYLFVSPVASVQVDRADMNWYRTQFNTGALSNCGPATVAMAFAWAKGGYLPVSSVRDAVGWQGNGSTSFEQLVKVLKNNDVPVKSTVTRKAQDFFDIVDRGNIAITLINTAKISRTKSNPAWDLFGRYYTDDVGHYVIVKGYTVDKKYLVVYDPIPSDWSSNNYRYNDGISMMGRNRYYPVQEVLGSLRRADVLEVTR